MIAESPRLRMSVLGIVVFALFASLFARLYYLQVMTTDQYQVAAQENRIRVVPVEAPRGRILDRNGKVLVDNRISVQVTIDRRVRRHRHRVLRRTVAAPLGVLILRLPAHLRPGRYRVTVIAFDDQGRRSRPVRRTLIVVAR